jgi:hypothetical protein
MLLGPALSDDTVLQMAATLRDEPRTTPAHSADHPAVVEVSV